MTAPHEGTEVKKQAGSCGGAGGCVHTSFIGRGLIRCTQSLLDTHPPATAAALPGVCAKEVVTDTRRYVLKMFTAALFIILT